MANVKLSNVIRRAQTKVDKDDTDLIFYVGGEHIESENIRVHSRGIIAESTIGPMFYYGFKAGDFLLVSRNPHLKKAGLVDFDGICSEKTFVLETADSDILLPEFLPFVLQNERFWDYAYRHRHGSTNTFINWSTLANYEFDLPDLETQRKLAEVLWSINDTMESYKKLISVTDELVKSQFIEMFGDPLTNPKGLTMTTIGAVCDFHGGSQPPRKEFIFEPKEGYVRLIQIRDYKTDEYITYAPKDKCRKFCAADDIMIGRYGPPIFQILQGIEGAYNVALMKAVPHGINKEFMRAYLKREELLHHLEQFQQRTAGQAGIDMGELRAYPCPLPSETEQLEYVEFIRQSDKSKFAVLNCSNLNLWSSLRS